MQNTNHLSKNILDNVKGHTNNYLVKIKHAFCFKKISKKRALTKGERKPTNGSVGEPTSGGTKTVYLVRMRCSKGEK